MDRYSIRLLQGGVTAVVVLALLFLACTLFPAFKPLILSWMRSEVGATWAGAIGTVFTLVGTIYLATDKDRKDKRVVERKAYVVAAKIAVPLDAYVDRVRTTHARLVFREENCFWVRAHLLEEARDWGDVSISDDDLTALTVLDGKHAFRLARAIQLARQFRENQRRESLGERGGMPLNSRELKAAESEVSAIVDILLVCSRFYKEILESHADDPSSAEVHGDPDA